MVAQSRLFFFFPLVLIIPVLLYWEGGRIWRRTPEDFLDIPPLRKEPQGDLPLKADEHPTHLPLPSNPSVPEAPPASSSNRVLVIATLRDLDTSWIQDLPSSLLTEIYTVDDPSSANQVPKNKGGESMAYLTYIIEHYEYLPASAIFVHQEQRNTSTPPSFLDFELGNLITRLNDERVQREGYVNLRCQLQPGCGKDALNLRKGREGLDDTLEEKAIKKSWTELFHSNLLPKTLSSPCCAQFAVTKEKLRSISLEQYKNWRTWLLNTELGDEALSRVWEHLWHYVFTNRPDLCPDPHTCYCDGYGMCFASSTDLQDWALKEKELGIVQAEYDEWKKGRRVLADVEKTVEFKSKIRNLQVNVETRLEEAWERGRNPDSRKAALARRPS